MKENKAPVRLQKKGFLYKFVRDPKAMIGFIFVALEILAVVFLPILQNLDPEMVYATAAGKSPELSGHIKNSINA